MFAQITKSALVLSELCGFSANFIDAKHISEPDITTIWD